MARENQGLQIALIVFVLLTILLAVTTFVSIRSYNHASTLAAANEKQAAQEQQNLRTALETVENLKRKMGFAQGDTPEVIEEQFKKDMTLYAGNYPEEAKFYRQVVERQGNDIKDLNKSLNTETATVKQLTEKLTSLNAETAANIAPIQAAEDKARKEKESEAQSFATARDQITAAQKQLADQLGQVTKDKDAKIAEGDAKITNLTGSLTEQGKTIQMLKERVNQMLDPKPETFLGEVRWVNQQSGVVWIDLGREDALRPQITFSVFPAGSHDVVELDKKASIEVTKILGSHLAEARITDDRLTDPVLPGDRIYTSVWSIGEKRHFALAGSFDLDNDGQSDLELLQTIIEMNGGVIDGKKDASGQRQGTLNVHTRYLVMGKEPGVTATPEEQKDYQDIQDAAAKFKVDTIPVGKFLDQMGWKRDVQVLPFAGGSASSFPVQVDETPQASGQKISELFKPRKPPRTAGGSTY